MDNLVRLKKRTGEEDEELLEDLLETAKVAILSRRYPYRDFPIGECGDAVLEYKYRDLQFRCALDLYNKMGAEGQLTHDANGINRTYESPWISDQLLAEVIPLAGTAT